MKRHLILALAGASLAVVGLIVIFARDLVATPRAAVALNTKQFATGWT